MTGGQNGAGAGAGSANGEGAHGGAVLVYEGAAKHYGAKAAVRDFSLALGAGETLCLLGPSGCGKTTALRLAAGLEDLDEGRIFLHGREVSSPGRSLAPEARGLGLVVQDFALFPHLTLAGNVSFGLRRLPRAERRERTERALALVGMEERRNDWPANLSGGEQQRIALARALAPAPKVLLLDEPFSALDVGLRRELRDHTLHLLQIGDSSSLLITHDPEEAMFMADRIALMQDGRLRQVGPPEELYFRPGSAFVAGFLGEVNEVPGVVAGDAVETALGRFARAELWSGGQGFAEGEEVAVVVRSEGLGLEKTDAAPAHALSAADGAKGAAGGAAEGERERIAVASVMEARSLGRTTLVHMSLPAPQGSGTQAFHLHARVPGFFAAAPGERVRLQAQEARSFVFPASEAGEATRAMPQAALGEAGEAAAAALEVPGSEP